MRLDAVVVSAFVPAGPTPLSSPTPQMDIPPTATPAPAPTEIPLPTTGLVVTNAFIKLRAGPGIAYALLGRLTQAKLLR